MPFQLMMSPPLLASVTGSSKTVFFCMATSASFQMSACRASRKEGSMWPSVLSVPTTFAVTVSPMFTFLSDSRADEYSRP